MNKQTIITILLALVAILSVSCVLKGQGKETKSAETKPKYATEQKKTQDDAVLTYDISSCKIPRHSSSPSSGNTTNWAWSTK